MVKAGNDKEATPIRDSLLNVSLLNARHGAHLKQCHAGMAALSTDSLIAARIAANMLSAHFSGIIPSGKCSDSQVTAAYAFAAASASSGNSATSTHPWILLSSVSHRSYSLW